MKHPLTHTQKTTIVVLTATALIGGAIGFAKIYDTEDRKIARHQQQFVRENCPGLTSYDACLKQIEDRSSVEREKRRAAAAAADARKVAASPPSTAAGRGDSWADLTSAACRACDRKRLACLQSARAGNLAPGSEKFADPKEAAISGCGFDAIECAIDAGCEPWASRAKQK